MKKTKMLFAFLLLATTALMFTGCGDDSTPAGFSITTASPLAAGTVGAAYGPVTLAASGGTGALTWSVPPATLPAGLILSTAGVITGNPTAAATTSFTVTVTDSATPTVHTATKLLSITVAAPATLTVTTPSPLAAGTVGAAYGPVTLAASGGTGALTWTWAAATGSALPAGLTLSTAGTITGTPTTAATANVNVTVTDSTTPTAKTATKAFTIIVSPAASGLPAAPTITSATGGTNSVTITWPAVTGATSYNIYWSTATGVTTANTKITGVTSPYRHSRLTATPTWLAASTPYFYIVTAVNGAGEGTASAQTTATTSATDGVALYAADCANCHSALATSAKVGRSAATIQTAINNNTGGMFTPALSTLIAAQVSAIADVLVAGF